jgi:regulation of enolase protein 1 (concanavalin A-like superfamily)
MKANCVFRPLAVACLVAICGAGSLGPFESNSDIGVTPQKGKVESGKAGEYRVSGGGADMWGKADAFHFVWKKMSGDMTVTADVQLLADSAQTKRKAALMVRQSLDAGSAYADVAFHGIGEIAAQWRFAAGDITGDTVLPDNLDTSAPVRIRIERRGNQFVMSAGKPGGQLAALAPVTVAMADPVYVGLAVCSHDANGLTTAVFSNVVMESLPGKR